MAGERRAVVLGRLAGAFGVDGRVRVKPFTESPDALLDFEALLLADPDGNWQRIRLRDGRVHGEHLIAALEGVTDREQAAALRGREIAVWRDELPEEAADEVYLVDLIGAKVIGRDGRDWGTIDGFIDVGSTQVMQVKAPPIVGDGGGGAGRQIAPAAGRPPDRETLIPFIDPYVVEVDLEQGQVTVDWQEAV